MYARLGGHPETRNIRTRNIHVGTAALGQLPVIEAEGLSRTRPPDQFEIDYREHRYSVNTTDCTPDISNRFRQRMFLHAIKSSLRSM